METENHSHASPIETPMSIILAKGDDNAAIGSSSHLKNKFTDETLHEFNLEETLHDLKHFLPAQAPLKDFVHHNTLHAFQHLKFQDGITRASKIFGYKVYLSIEHYQLLYAQNRIDKEILNRIVIEKKGTDNAEEWLKKLHHQSYDGSIDARIGTLRDEWKKRYYINLDGFVHPLLFRILCNYLDQGIAVWDIPIHHKGLLSTIRELERHSFTSFFKTKRAQTLLLENVCGIEHLLDLLVGDRSLYKQYLFDQQFAHQGWSGMVATISNNPHSLLDARNITLNDLIALELLLEIDALDYKLGSKWTPLNKHLLHNKPIDIFAPTPLNELDEILHIWQEAFEWSYHDRVLAGIQLADSSVTNRKNQKFQAIFCIDDRECSVRRSVEHIEPLCETFGTAGFFGVEFYYQPQHGKFVTKVCPAPVTPQYLIKEIGKEHNVTVPQKPTNWLVNELSKITSTIKLAVNVLHPVESEVSTSSFKHMDPHSTLSIVCSHPEHKENGLQIGFTVDEMVIRMENVLRSIGLVDNFASVVYFVGHGASSTNNTHYAGYDCGACSGRPGSVNARVAAFMLNHEKVRALLKTKGIDIPEETQFIGALHDTTRDEIAYYDEDILSNNNRVKHEEHQLIFIRALDFNAKERSRRFENIDTKQSLERIHDAIKKRSVALFEPRPELNHATNALCIVGRRELTKQVYLDRRAFLNSYDYRIDPAGNSLLGIMNAVAPVCGGINLEYYFSRVDNEKLGAGTKLPHNVMGLIGVANGVDGDLRPGLPSQMIEVHDPIRLLTVVEHFPNIVLQTIQKNASTYEWFANEWVKLIAIHPETKACFVFKEEKFVPYQPFTKEVETIKDVSPLWEKHQENIPTYLLE